MPKTLEEPPQPKATDEEQAKAKRQAEFQAIVEKAHPERVGTTRLAKYLFDHKGSLYFRVNHYDHNQGNIIVESRFVQVTPGRELVDWTNRKVVEESGPQPQQAPAPIPTPAKPTAKAPAAKATKRAKSRK